MDEYAEDGVSGSVVRDRDGRLWRVYFQGRLLAPSFESRAEAIGYLAGMRGGSRKPEYARVYKGKEVRD
jgi:hypothetical protein